jgi:hypothetical protein
MTMTKKDYILIAAVLAKRGCHIAQDPAFREGWHAALSAYAHALADALASENPRFDRARFLAACGVQS